ncbi:5-formyltetrahydrofolate cyclo-ligase family protein [Aedoeadaptatus ivorii]|uniref:5-formyltetrahydrofolate cyclo-ligase n=1 Tax=Aedoeadaptatus ivorii TaxID=54006 RepID=A0A3S4Z405_9FIRM|nr:5-formyltetrahydrofolate cyclo-ligase [Peptoniphilus ivorii]MDQ0508108.1 5-formyltetrahydrofolate cyclo-ligase [Peptoniphilus ivorii]VEJ35839.1 5-formyltetrahydrofolate cyclo-ligase family protein [Peptoniphilus ivorii]
MKKTYFRNTFKEIRKNIPENERKRRSETIFNRLCALKRYRNAERIFLFVSFGTEVETLSWIPALLKEKKVYIPYTDAANHTMQMTEIYDACELEKDAMGIYALPPVLASARLRDAADLILTPGLAFDREGHRLGYGGGYYDRFFQSHGGFRLGIGFSEQLTDALPADPHDLPLHAFLSESDYLRFS